MAARGQRTSRPSPRRWCCASKGPAAIEIQHQSGVILERVNRFFGWQAVGRIALRQAPLSRPKAKAAPPRLDAAEAARVAATLTDVTDDEPAGGAGAARRRGQKPLTPTALPDQPNVTGRPRSTLGEPARQCHIAAQY